MSEDAVHSGGGKQTLLLLRAVVLVKGHRFNLNQITSILQKINVMKNCEAPKTGAPNQTKLGEF